MMPRASEWRTRPLPASALRPRLGFGLQPVVAGVGVMATRGPVLVYEVERQVVDGGRGGGG